MASKTVEDLIDSYLAANWTTSPIYTENQQGEIPDDGSSFIILQFPVSNVERVAVNERLYREEGGFRIVIATQRGAGTSVIRTWGQQLASLFRDVQIGTVNCRVPSEPFTDDQSDKGLYFQGSMIVPFDRVFYG